MPAPTGEFDFVKFAESLKRYPDTKPRFSAFLWRRALQSRARRLSSHEHVRTMELVMGVTAFCEIRIPVPGLGGRGADDGNAFRAGKTATVRICTPTSRRCK